MCVHMHTQEKNGSNVKIDKSVYFSFGFVLFSKQDFRFLDFAAAAFSRSLATNTAQIRVVCVFFLFIVAIHFVRLCAIRIVNLHLLNKDLVVMW